MAHLPEEPDLLLAAARAGDRDALNGLLEIYRNYLQLLASLQVAVHSQLRLEASELVQQTMLDAFQGFGAFAGQTQKQWMAWLRQIMIRNLTDQLRARKAQKRDFGRQESLEEQLDRSAASIERVLADTGSSPSSVAMRKERAVLLADALSRLPDDYRQVIVLRQLRGLAFTEVAQRMGRSEGAVRKMWTRALARLRKDLRGLT